MFLESLSCSLQRICEIENLSFERAAHLCSCSPSHFGRIIQKKTCPSVIMLEHFCYGFHASPDELLVNTVMQKWHQEQIEYRIPMRVNAVRLHHFWTGDTTFPICPRCGITMEREYQAYCDRCGQALSWKGFRTATIIRSD